MDGLAQKLYFVPRRSRFVSANPVSFPYTVKGHADNREFTICDPKLCYFTDKWKCAAQTILKVNSDLDPLMHFLRHSVTAPDKQLD